MYKLYKMLLLKKYIIELNIICDKIFFNQDTFL
jgi:hypothetical protein